MWSIFAQTDSISGGAGWVGAGLLGGVLSWLLFVHLPKIMNSLENKDKQFSDLMAQHDKTEKEQRQEYRVSLQLVVDGWQACLQTLTSDFHKQIDQVTSEMNRLRDVVLEMRNRGAK